MLTISDVAADKAVEILKAEGKEGWGLRIFVAGSSCCGPSFGMDILETPKDGDQTLEHNGLKVFVDTAAVEKLTGMEMDFVDDGKQQGFIIKGNEPTPPAGGCGCSSGSCH